MSSKVEDRILIEKSSFNTIESFFIEVKRILNSYDTELLPPAIEKDISTFEKKFNVKLSI